MRWGAVAVWLMACGEQAHTVDSNVFLPEVAVDLVSPEVVSDTIAEVVSDTIPEVGLDTAADSGPHDAFAPDTTDLGHETDTISDGHDTGLPTASCPTPSLIESFPPPFPPSPFGEWPHAEGCVGGRHDVVLVLGCPSNNDGSPSRCQERRAEMADHLYEAGLADHLIVSGAAVHTPHVEADALATLLFGRGIPEAAIIKEPLARHTDENLYYGTRLMEAHGWQSAIVVSDEPGHLVYTGLCDANCCVKLGRMTLWSFDVGANGRVNAGHYALTPPGPGVAEAECSHLGDLLLCTNLEDRLACRDDFRLE